jgi:hypothetical protein
LHAKGGDVRGRRLDLGGVGLEFGPGLRRSVEAGLAENILVVIERARRSGVKKVGMKRAFSSGVI